MLSLKKLTAVFATLTLLGGLVVIAIADETANQTVEIVVPQIISVSATGGTVQLTIVDVDTEVNDSTSADLTYTNNTATNKKITAKGDSIPSGITMKVQVGSGTQVTLSTSDADVTSPFSQTKATEDITYTASASATAASTTHSILVTYTITDG